MNVWKDFMDELSYLIEAVDAFEEMFGGATLAVADHFCYRCESSEEYEYRRKAAEKQMLFSYTSFIPDRDTGREISLILFRFPIQTAYGPVSLLELSNQKRDGSQKSGFDHVEIAPKPGISYEELHRALTDRGATFAQAGRPHHPTYDHRLSSLYTLRLTRERLIEKVTGEMLAALKG